MMHFYQRFFFTLCFTATGYAGYTQSRTTDTTATTKPVTELLPIEILSLRAGNNSPFVNTNIDRKTIERQNLGQDLPMLLGQTPSAVVTTDAGAGVGYTGLRVRGTDGTRINVTLNGVPVNDAESQGTFFVNTPDLASSAGSIQLQRGVGTSTNGAAAFGATLSISNMEQMSRAGAEVNISGGSFNTQKYTLKAGTGLLDNGWQFDVRLSKISSDGYIRRSASDLKALQIIAGWQLTPNTKLRFHVMSGSEKTGQAWNGVPQDSLRTDRRYNELGLKADGTYYDNQTDNYGQTYYQAFLDHNINSHWSLHTGLFLTRGKGYYQEYRLGESFSSYGLPDFVTPQGDTFANTNMIRQLWLDNYYYGGIYAVNYSKGKWQATFGGAVTQYKGLHYGYVKWADYGVPDDYRWYRNDAQKNDVNNYLKAQYAAGSRLNLYADLQLRQVSYFMNGFRKNAGLRPSANYSFFNPKAGFNYMLEQQGTKSQRVYASVAIAGKEPNRDDFEANTAQLPKAEHLTDVEAGYTISRKSWSIAANVFYMGYTNQLVLNGQINDVGAYTRINVGSSYRSGVELQAGVQACNWLNISGNLTLSQNKIRSFDEYIDNWDNGGQDIVHHSNTDIAFSPRTIAATDIRITPFRGLGKTGNQSLELNLLGKFVDRQYLDNTENKARSIADYSLLDVSARYAIHMPKLKELSLTVTVYNTFNRQYESNGYNYSYINGGSLTLSNYYFPQAGTHFLAGVGVKL